MPYLSIETFGALTENKAKAEAREALKHEARHRGLTTKGRVTYQTEEKLQNFWSCKAEVEVR